MEMQEKTPVRGEMRKRRASLTAVSLAKAIRAKCLDCCCRQPSEVRECTATHCPLHRFRNRKVGWESAEK